MTRATGPSPSEDVVGIAVLIGSDGITFIDQITSLRICEGLSDAVANQIASLVFPSSDGGHNIVRKPAETSFSRAADARASLSDVVMSYQILLGRDPENSTVMAAGTTQTIAAVIRGLFQSAEFSSCVAQPIAEEALTRHDMFSDRPSPEQIAWLLDKIDTTPKTKAHLRAAADWSRFMGLCLVLLQSAIAKSNNSRAEQSAKVVDSTAPMKNASKKISSAASSRMPVGVRSKQPTEVVSQHNGFTIQFW